MTKNSVLTLIALMGWALASSASAFSVNGKVMCDANSNGMFDENDVPLEGVTVTVSGQGFSLFADTSADGTYRVAGFPSAGDVTVTVALEEGASLILPAGGSYPLTFFFDPNTGDLSMANYYDIDFLISDASCRDEPPPPSAGVEGCTPGYWRQPHHFDSYPNYYPIDLGAGTLFSAVFGSEVFGTQSLSQVAAARGGGINALGRHAVAALLNASTVSVDYALTRTAVVEAFVAAINSGDAAEIERVKDWFESFNDGGNCPL